MKPSKSHNALRQLLTTIIVVSSCVFYGASQAIEDSAWHESNSDWVQADGYSKRPAYQTDIRSKPSSQRWSQSNRWTQNKNGSIRSKGEVINEVKRRYNATVLKIKLNEQRAVYNVRILLPSGKVKSVQVSARR